MKANELGGRRVPPAALTLIQEVLKQHHFDYSLENRPQGGAEFRISFPAGAASPTR